MIVEEDISIHPPHAGRDQIAARINSQMIGFQSTRPMRGGTLTIFPRSISWVFQSTRPMRGGTANISRSAQKSGYFNPPAPCGAGQTPSGSVQENIGISIHPPHAGRDLWADLVKVCSLWISIHPPHAGRDIIVDLTAANGDNFNPPAPCGAGQQSCTKFTPCILAQYTIQRAAKLLFAYQQSYFC